MPAPKGNRNSVGKGRKGAYAELKNAARLQAIWTTPGLYEQIQERIRNKTATAEDIFLAKGFAEDVRPLIEIFKKLHPDTLDITSKGEKIIPIFNGLSKYEGDAESIRVKEED